MIIMGKNQSKDTKEEIIIAQSGSNVSGIEAQLSQFGMMMIVALIILATIIIYILYKSCTAKAKRWLFRQMRVATPVSPPPQQQVMTTASPPRVISVV